jgi:putative intracellular protease/amidase
MMKGSNMRLSILIFDGYTTLDLIGGYEVLSRLPGMEVEFVAEKTGPVAADTRRLGLIAYRDFETAGNPDILYVPGGPGVTAALKNEELVAYIRASHATSRFTIGICNGVELLGAAGVLAGTTVTTNYFARDRVAAYGATVVPARFHRDGKLITGAGVSASIDTGFFVAREIAGDFMARALQLGLEYYPQPPFGEAISADEAADEIKAAVLGFEQGGGSAAMLQLQPPFAGALGHSKPTAVAAE